MKKLFFVFKGGVIRDKAGVVMDAENIDLIFGYYLVYYPVFSAFPGGHILRNRA